jgi:serine-type D-Ala-D-Ala carboxypeptidase (penicillin-binding protein 5/6)
MSFRFVGAAKAGTKGAMSAKAAGFLLAFCVMIGANGWGFAYASPLKPAGAEPVVSGVSSTVLNQTDNNGVPMTAEPDKSWPTIVSKAAVVMDLSTGTIVYAKNPEQAHYPASITKILTAMIALQKGQLTDELTASTNAVNQPSDKLYMVPGEKHTLHDLLYALLLDSANDAAVEIAENYGGSVSGFAKMMNDEAHKLGATHTNFVNPNGLPNSHHVTTAYDMAVITRAAMQIPEFRQIVHTKMFHWKGKAWQSDLWNLNKMLFYYPGATGVKTGYTSVAHETLVVASTRGSQSFLAVMMDNPTDYEIRQDASALLDYAFTHYDTETVMPAGMAVGQMTDQKGDKIGLATTEPVVATVLKSARPDFKQVLAVHAPESQKKQGTVVGKLEFSQNGATTGSVPVEITDDWQLPLVDTVTHSPTWMIGAGAAGIIIIGGIFFMWRRLRRRKDGTTGGTIDGQIDGAIVSANGSTIGSADESKLNSTIGKEDTFGIGYQASINGEETEEMG